MVTTIDVNPKKKRYTFADLKREVYDHTKIRVSNTQFYLWLRFAYVRSEGDRRTRGKTYTEKDRRLLLKFVEYYLQSRSLKLASDDLFEHYQEYPQDFEENGND